MKVITKLTAAAVGAGVVIRQVSRSRARPAADASREPPATARLGDRYRGHGQQTGDTVARKRERRRRKATPAVSPRARRAGARSVSPSERKDPDGPSAADPFVAGVPAADRT
jgi:hypothetical protein